jgi:ectoine hydroxylase-related dioxygenase (phytanoyl-CoA dioxygenase family)
MTAGSVAVGRAIKQFKTRDYARIDRVFPAALTRRLAREVASIRRKGRPPVSLALSDEFWLLARSGPVRRFLHGVLGRRVYQSPNVWVHVVDAREEAAGWAPHRDHTDGHRVTLWIPLTPAGVDDGCISLLPPHLLPARLSGLWRTIDRFSRAEVLALLHAARPVPADAGSVVCWRANVLHWGGRRTRTGTPRIACSMEFSARPIDPREIGMPSMPLQGPLPTLKARLDLVARMVLLYDR